MLFSTNISERDFDIERNGDQFALRRYSLTLADADGIDPAAAQRRYDLRDIQTAHHAKASGASQVGDARKKVILLALQVAAGEETTIKPERTAPAVIHDERATLLESCDLHRMQHLTLRTGQWIDGHGVSLRQVISLTATAPAVMSDTQIGG